MRANGILMPIFSLPSPYGIGTFGKAAYGFVDFLKKSGQSYWQMLPIGPTGYGDSPYQSFSCYAGNPYFVDLDMLCDEGLLTRGEIENYDFGSDRGRVDYGKLYENRGKILKKAYNRFRENIPDDYERFCLDSAFWLDDYALYTAIKSALGGAPLRDWERELRFRQPDAISAAREKYSEEIKFNKAVQYWFYKQWYKLKEYANENGIKLIGDMPIYVSVDSADLWADPKQFLLDENYHPLAVAGCPPDIFSPDGQLWGNPLYNWNYMEKDDFSWWCRRIRFAKTVFDIVRIDHFRAFDAYYSIPATSPTAANGEWVKGPGMKLFDTVNREVGSGGIIAEDLGHVTDSVIKLLEDTGYPGMAVLQFAFDPDGKSRYLPHNIVKNSVVYTGTHDNNTIVGWLENISVAEWEFCVNYLRLTKEEGYCWGMMRAAMATASDTCILLMQDIIGLGSDARINEPGVGEGNWQWRIDGGCLNDWLAGIIYDNTKLYSRLGEED